MMYILHDLWYGIAPYEWPFRKDGEYAKTAHKFIGQEEALRSMLTDDARAQLDAMLTTHNAFSALSEQERFIDGFRMGARMMLDVLGEHSGEFLEEK